MTDRPLREIKLGSHQEPKPPPDAGRWLVLTLIELSKRFLGMAAAAGFKEAERRCECECGKR